MTGPLRSCTWIFLLFGLTIDGAMASRAVASSSPASRRAESDPAADPADPRSARLATVARDLEARLRADQKPAGYWPTAFTSTAHFDQPSFEMDTFVTSMIVSVLDPVAEAIGLQRTLARARVHLADQIEPNGLVRYYGRPDSPTFSPLGGVITPDTDDTALVWTVAGNGRQSLLPGVLAILKSYRTREGLYRTWLAPLNQYVGIDRGQDPNPTDIGIQMDLLVFLAKVDPPAARSLCDALQRAIGEDRIWVYYKKTPLLPLLREADLNRLGYALRLPPERRQPCVSGQGDWIRVCELLGAYISDDRPKPSASATVALLGNLAESGVSGMRHNPPLFYHNDLTATVRRFYWSEDFGYALWLRLYVENASHALVARSGSP